MQNTTSKRGIIRISIDGSLPVTFSAFLYATIVVDFIRKGATVGWLPVLPTTVIRNAIYVLCFIVVFIDCIRHRKVMIPIVFFGSFLLLIGVSYFLNPSVSPLLPDTLLLIISRFFPAFYLFFTSNGWEERIKMVYRFRFLLYLYFLLAIINYARLSNGYMEIAYNLLCPTLIVLYYALRNKKMIPMVGMTVISLFIMGFGSRGAIACVLLSFVCYFVLSYSTMSKAGRVVSIILIILLAVVVAISFTSLLDVVSEKLPISRTIKYLLEGKFFSDESASIRVKLISLCWNEVKAHPLTVRGIMADRFLLGGYFGASNISAYYAHNVIIELLYQFGLFFGGIGVVLFALSVIKSFVNVFRSHNKTISIVYSACVAAVIPFMMFSGSYLTEAMQWFAFSFAGVLAFKRWGDGQI